MAKCEYPECNETAEYGTDKNTGVCQKHYDMYKFIMTEVKFALKELNIK